MKSLKTICLLMFAASAAFAQVELLGAGATFPYPLYSKLFSVYNQEKGTKVNYQSIGSGGGIRQIFGETVDFGATDGIVPDDQLATAKRPLLHIPTVLGAVGVTYNLAVAKELKLTPEVLADIFLGKVTHWNDPKLVALNAGVNLPKQKIVVVRRSDGSGTTAIFTDYLAKISPEWAKTVGAGNSVSWPAGLGAKGNEGVAGLVRQMPGSLGYVELAYTIQNKMSVATLQNKSGKWIKPTLASTSAAAGGNIPDDTRVSITNSDHPEAYPISGFTWILVYQEQNYGGRAKPRAQELARLLWWVVHEGQQYAEPLHYAKLPTPAQQKVEVLLRSITFDGQKLLP